MCFVRSGNSGHAVMGWSVWTRSGTYFRQSCNTRIYDLIKLICDSLSCSFSRLDQTARDIGHVLFSLFNVAWASLYLEAWRRYSVELAFRWGTLSTPPELLEPPRPLYKVINKHLGFLNAYSFQIIDKFRVRLRRVQLLEDLSRRRLQHGSVEPFGT